jgi:hypothetical protein
MVDYRPRLRFASRVIPAASDDVIENWSRLDRRANEYWVEKIP